MMIQEQRRGNADNRVKLEEEYDVPVLLEGGNEHTG